MSDTKVNLFLADGATPAGWANVPAEYVTPYLISVEGKLYRFIPQLVGFGPVPTPSYAEVVPVTATRPLDG